MLNILFISRAYPPTIGGIEKQNFELAQALGGVAKVHIIANHRGKKFLPLFFCVAMVKTLLFLPRCDAILLGDGVLAILGFLIKKITKKPILCIVHGLDLTFPQKIYQSLWLHKFLPVLDQYIAVGNETIRQGISRGLDKDKFVFIGNGVGQEVAHRAYTRVDLEFLVGKPLPAKVLLTLGRQVKRKGVEWWVKEVMPSLPDDIAYIIAGGGKELPAIQASVKALQLENRVFCLGEVTDEQKQLLFKTVDVFVQPNIAVAGDMEGFGIVVLEAAMAGCFVVASDLEGLKDAISHGENGLLVASGDAEAYTKIIIGLLADKLALRQLAANAQSYVKNQCSWETIAQKYLHTIAATVAKVNQ